MSKKKKPVRKPGRLLKWLPYILMVALVFLIYQNTFETGFHFDDETSIIKNEKITSVNNFMSFDEWTKIHKRPLPYFTIALNYALYGRNPAGYHVFNVIIHAITTILVYLLTFTLINLRYSSFSQKKKVFLSLGVSLLFAAHPIQTMAVTYIVQRMASLAALFYILSIFFYIKARTTSNSRGLSVESLGLYLATVISFYLALVSKQNAATIPIIWWFCELFFIRDSNKKIAKKYLIIFGSILVAGISFVLLKGMLPKEVEEISRYQYLITQFKVLVKYLVLVFYPIGLNIDHGVELSNSLFGFYEITGLIIIVFLVAASVYFFKMQRLISFGIVWFLVTMSVESSIIPIRDLMFEHRLYLPVYGLLLSFVAGLFLLVRKNLNKFTIIIVIILLLLGIRTYHRNFDWKNNTQIWLSSLEENPNNKRALVYIGRAYRNSSPQKALEYFNKAIQVDSSYYHGWLNRGLLYYQLKNYPMVIKSLNTANSLPGKHHQYSYFLRGVSHLMVKHYDSALLDLTKYIEKNKNYADAYHFRAEANYYLKNFNESAEDFLKVIEIDPKRSKIYLNLIQIYYLSKDFDEMRKYISLALQQGLEVNPQYLKIAKETK